MDADLAPPLPAPVPRTILYQRKRANRRILNENMFLDLLREFGKVCVPCHSIPFADFKPIFLQGQRRNVTVQLSLTPATVLTRHQVFHSMARCKRFEGLVVCVVMIATNR